MTLATNLMAEYWRQNFSSRLPAGYREVEYIESTGAQWIDTGVKDLYAYMDIFPTEPNGTGQQLCGYTSRASEYFFVELGKIKVQNGNSVDIPQDRFKLAFTRGTVRLNDDSDIAPPATKPTLSFKIAGLYNPSYTYGGIKAKWYDIQMRDANHVARQLFVPCVLTADSKPGLYDLCGSICPLTNSPFYINAGTGADFTWGELQ